MTQYLDPEEDYLTIAAAEEQMSARASARQKELEEARNNLKGKCGPVLFTFASVRPHTITSTTLKSPGTSFFV